VITKLERQTIKFLHTHMPDFTKPEIFRTISPDLNPLQQLIYREHICKIDPVAVIMVYWEQINQDMID